MFLRPSRPFLAGLLLLLLLATAPGAWAKAVERETRIGGVAVVVWTSVGLEYLPQEARLPLILFSHGMYMCPTQARFLTMALAERGYIVIAPRHADSNCEISIWPELARMGFKPSPLWTESDFRDRAEDIRRIVQTLPLDPRFRTRVDISRIALAGHSLGGYTVLGLGGAWPSWRLEGVRAILALSPYTLPFQSSAGLKNLGAPVMYQIGTLDPLFSLPIGPSGFAFEQTPPPKYLVEIDGAAHLAWTDLGTTARDAIVDYASAFFDRHVLDRPFSDALEQRRNGVSSFVMSEAAKVPR